MRKGTQERLGRGAWYILRTVLILVLIAALGWFVFMIGLNASNLYILASEGMALRAECVLQDGAIVELTEYFTQDFITDDEILYQGAYDNYTVSDYNYKLSVQSMWVLPWSASATMEVTERVTSIAGAINKDSIPEDAAEGTEYPLPIWEAGTYRLTFTKQNHRWYISGVTLLQQSPPEEELRTPELSQMQ